jgi:hypothetical protein
MDKNGLVTIVSNKGSAAGRTVAQNLITPVASPSEWSFSQITDGLMNALASAALIVVTFTRKVFFTDDAAGQAALVADIPESDYVEFRPDASQTGRALEWSLYSGQRVNLTADQLDAVQNAAASIITEVKPRKTAASVVQEALALVDEMNVPVFRTVIFDQVNKRIRAYPVDFTADLLDAAPTAGNSGVLEVDGDSTPDDPNLPKLPFEGGAV